MKYIIKLFNYLRSIWEDGTHRPSIKRVLALYFSYIVGSNTNYAVQKWSEGRSMADLYLVLGIGATLVAALLGLTAYFNYMERKLSQNNTQQSIEQVPGGSE